jgi:hypothetical protein
MLNKGRTCVSALSTYAFVRLAIPNITDIAQGCNSILSLRMF